MTLVIINPADSHRRRDIHHRHHQTIRAAQAGGVGHGQRHGEDAVASLSLKREESEVLSARLYRALKNTASPIVGSLLRYLSSTTRILCFPGELAIF